MPDPAIAAQPRKNTNNHTNRRDRYTDDEFWADNPDERAAYRWLAGVFWPEGPRCPTCWSCDVTDISPGPVPRYRCSGCKQDFSIVTKTLMDGLEIPLREWRHAVFIFTGGPTISSPRELAERIGWDDRTAREVTYRLLQAAAEPNVPLQEPSEDDCTELVHPTAAGCTGKSSVHATIGRCSRRVTGLRRIPSQHLSHISRSVGEDLAPGMKRFCDDHASNRGIRGEDQHTLAHGKKQFARGPACTNLAEGLWPRLKRVLHVDYSWYIDQSLTHWLDGLRWWENHRTLGHRERMSKLAEAMLHKKPQRIIDPVYEQQEMGQLCGPPCTDCRNVHCLATRNTSFGRERPPRANPYQARRV